MAQKDYLSSFPDRLKEIIGNDTINTAAEKCGMTPPAFSKYLKGVSLPGLEFLVNIARAYSVNIEWLATGGGPRHGVYVKPMEPQNLREKNYPFSNCPDGGVFCKEFGNNLKLLRERKRISIEDLCTDLRVTREDYEAMEMGFLPDPDFLHDFLSASFKCNPGAFFYGDKFIETKKSLRRLFLDYSVDNMSPDLEEFMSSTLDNFILYQAVNDSMSPTLNTYELVLCKEKINKFSNGLYLIKSGPFSEVRRLTFIPNSRVIVSCDNSLIPSFTEIEEIILSKIEGKVIYILKSISSDIKGDFIFIEPGHEQ